MAFFRNTAVNLLNLHYGINAVAMNGGVAFFLIFLIQSGIPVSGALASLALILIVRFAIRPLVIVAAVRWGLRPLVIAGTVLSALVYPVLARVHGVGITLAALIAVTAIGDTLYWTTYHAYFAALGDDDHRGQQVGVREAMAAVVGVASPLLTGGLLVSFGPRVAFGTTAAVAMLSALPLLWAPNVAVRRQVSGAFRAALPGVLLFAADGWIAAGSVFVWQIALFVSLHESMLGYGGALAFAALVGAIGGMTLGRQIDAGHGKLVAWYVLGGFALIVMFRAVAAGHAAVAVLASALGAFGYCLYIPTLMTPIYTLAKRSPCALRFHIAAEGGWDAGGAAGLLTVAAAIALGMRLSVCILLSLAGVAAIGAVLRGYYANVAPAAAVDAG